MVQHLLKDHQDMILSSQHLDKDAIYIQDGNVLFYELTNLSQSRNLGGICHTILKQMCHKRNFIFSMDSYQELSIKSSERVRRGERSDRLIGIGPATISPADFKRFLTNPANKREFCELVKDVWSSKDAGPSLSKVDRTAAVVAGGVFYSLSVEGDRVSSG